MNKKSITIATGAVGVLVAGLALGCGPKNAGGSTRDHPIESAKPAATSPAKPPAPKNVISGDGTFKVSDQITPGTYRTVVPNDSYGCYYSRLKGASGQLDDIIANEIGEPGSQQIVNIASTDVYFQTKWCGTWTKIG